ncbi:MAG: VPLPA-CTERM sorting domain-containing protein [Pseudomonadota bacterium]
MKLFKIAALLAAVILPAAANASTVSTLSQTLSFNSISQNGTPNFTRTLSGFDAFDAPGELLSVTLTVNANLSGQSRTDRCRIFQDCDPALGELVLSGNGSAFAGVADRATASTGITNATNATQVGTYSVLLNSTFTNFDTADFVGTGPVSGGIRLEGDYLGFAYFNGSNFSFAGDATLTYAFAAVPLPAALPLLLVGVGAFGVAARKKRHRKTA